MIEGERAMREETDNTHKQKKEGSAILIVMCIASILLISGIALSFMAANASHMSRKINNQARALAVAEAGIADMINKMTTNYSGWRDLMTNTDSYGEGSYTASTLTDTNTGHVIVTSVGTLGNDVRTTVIELLGTIWDLYNATFDIADAIISGGDIILKSSAITINGGIHSNGSIIKEAGNPTINGDVSAVGGSEVTASGTNNTTTNASPLIVPDYRDFDDGDPNWLGLAQSNGLYYATGQAFGSVDLVPSNGVIYVNGDVTFGNNSSYVGTLVSAGSITVNNRLSHTAYNTNWPAMLALVDISLNNLNTYWGVIWAANNINMDNRRTVNGTIIAYSGTVTIDNRMTLEPLPWYPAWDPADTNKDPPEVVIGGWLR